MDTQIRIRLDQYHALRNLLVQDTTVEQGCFLLCSETRVSGELVLVTNEIIPLTNQDFAQQRFDLLSVSPKAMLRVARLAQQKNMSVCFIHTHPMAERDVDFSYADDVGNVATFNFFSRMVPDKPHTALVFNNDLSQVSGRIYKDGSHWEKISRISVPGAPYLVSTNSDISPVASGTDKFSRQTLLLGEKGQQILSKLNVVIVGLGGIGSISSVILVHSGITNCTLIEHDHIESSNTPRVIYASPEDVAKGALKVHINREYLGHISPDCNITVIPEKVQSKKAFEQLVIADLIIIATDNAKSRAYLNEICHRYYVPLLDLGVEFISNDDGDLVNEVGKANLILPGTPCLWCTGHITSELLTAEELPKDVAEQRAKEGYVKNIHIAQPSMMPYNAEIASRGAQVAIHQFTGLSPCNLYVYERFRFLGLNDMSHHSLVRKRHKENCPFCSKSGEVLGHANNSSSLFKPAA